MSYPLNRLKIIFGKSPKYIDARANNRVRAKWFFKDASETKFKAGILAAHDVDFERFETSNDKSAQRRYRENPSRIKTQTHWIAVTYENNR